LLAVFLGATAPESRGTAAKSPADHGVGLGVTLLALFRKQLPEAVLHCHGAYVIRSVLAAEDGHKRAVNITVTGESNTVF